MTAPRPEIRPTYRRELPEFVTVSVEGSYEDVDPDITERTPGRVVVAMPDFTAESLAHVLDHLGRFAALLDVERLGVGPDDLAHALHEAAAVTGVPCATRSDE